MKAFLIWFSAVLGLDLLTKWLAETLLPGVILPLGNLIVLKLCRNEGIAFGMIAGIPWLGTVLSILLMFFGIWLLRRAHPGKLPMAMAGCIAGGAVGNLLQRIFLGAVTDMLYFPFLPWFICNIADIGVCFGAAVMAVSLFFRPQDWPQ